MKKSVKIIAIALAVLLSAAGGYYYMTMPLVIPAVRVMPKTAELYFTEQGIAGFGRTVEVYSPVSGMIVSVAVTEGQEVKLGDALCEADASGLRYEALRIESDIRSFRAQIENLGQEEKRQKDALRDSLSELQNELKVLEARESASALSETELLRIKDEQLRLQQIIVEQSERDLERSLSNLEKAKTLYEAGVIPVSEYDSAAEAVELLQAVLSQSAQQLRVIESGDAPNDAGYYAASREAILSRIKGVEEALTRSYTEAMAEYYGALIESGNAAADRLHKQIEDSVVTAPISGVVTRLYVKDTNMLNAQAPVALIAPDPKCVVEVYVLTSDVSDIYAGQRVDLIMRRRGGDAEYGGSVREIDGEAVVRLSALGVEERRVKVIIDPDPGADELRKGYDADVRFVVFREEGRLTAPKTAFFSADGRDMVWTVRNGKACIAEVVKGRELRTEYIVESGLSAGDLVITDANNLSLREGVNVAAE